MQSRPALPPSRPTPSQLALDFQSTPQMRAAGGTGGMRIIAANGIEPLFDDLARRMRRAVLPPFEFETILLPHGSALRPWLNQGLADRLGCAASLYTPTIREYADALIRHLLGSEPDAFDRRTLAWRIFAFLNDLPDDAALAPVRRYLKRADGQTMTLARRLAELFDSYQTLRIDRSEEHTSELQSRGHLVCRLLLEKKNITPEGLLAAT